MPDVWAESSTDRFNLWNVDWTRSSAEATDLPSNAVINVSMSAVNSDSDSILLASDSCIVLDRRYDIGSHLGETAILHVDLLL